METTTTTTIEKKKKRRSGFRSTDKFPPEETGMYEIRTNLPKSYELPVVKLLYDEDTGWRVPKLIAPFFKVKEWRPITKRSYYS